MNNLKQQLTELLHAVPTKQMELLPSEFAEKNRTLTSDVSALAVGKFKYDYTPYLREVIDTLSPYHDLRIGVVMKAAQIGYTEGMIVNGILYLIANNPGNIMWLSANDALSKEAVESRLDQGLQSCGIYHLIRPNTIRKRNQRTGDTSQYKEFAGGRLFAGGLQSIDKLGKQRSIKYGFFDDWDAAPIADKEQGNIFKLLQQRFATSANTMKQYYISTPETRPSNIEKLYLMGDQRKWRVPCPKCGAYIELLWNEKIEGEKVGIVYELDKNGKLIEKSVGYVCQECGQFWTEKYKYDINLAGQWHPTSESSRPGFYSYHIPAFCSAPGMYTWTHYCYEWIDIFKDGIQSNSKRKVFKNLVEGLPWEEKQKKITSNQLAKNTREYEIGIVPNELSKKDGNGEIMILTCACDLNGTIDDARLDYEVQAHSVNGSTYSIIHGSVGTYWPGNKDENRAKWTYRNNQDNNVWDYFYSEVVNIDYFTDDNRTMRILKTAVDTAYYTHFAYGFIDAYPEQLIGVRGWQNEKYQKANVDIPLFKPARERNNLYILVVDLLKDKLAELIFLPLAEPQHAGTLNFPQPANGLYTVPGYFVQYEAEEKKIEESDDGEPIGWKWVRKYSSAANHFFDIAIYNMATRDIIARSVCKELGLKEWSWEIFCGVIENL
jgi:phage terminase large subunit GpA-like protein